MEPEPTRRRVLAATAAAGAIAAGAPAVGASDTEESKPTKTRDPTQILTLPCHKVPGDVVNCKDDPSGGDVWANSVVTVQNCMDEQVSVTLEATGDVSPELCVHEDSHSSGSHIELILNPKERSSVYYRGSLVNFTIEEGALVNVGISQRVATDRPEHEEVVDVDKDKDTGGGCTAECESSCSASCFGQDCVSECESECSAECSN